MGDGYGRLTRAKDRPMVAIHPCHATSRHPVIPSTGISNAISPLGPVRQCDLQRWRVGGIAKDRGGIGPSLMTVRNRIGVGAACARAVCKRQLTPVIG